jgi:K+-sensing histidine kinase KdpD
MFSIVLALSLLFLYWLFIRTKKAEANLQKQRLITEKQNQELKKQNELQLMTIGIVGHDLRGPLSSAVTLKTILNLFLENGDIKSAKELSGHLFDALERINSLANNLVQWVLSAQSGINLDFSEIKVFNLVEKVSNTFIAELKAKNISLNNEVEISYTVFADASSVETIIRNVLQNAIKFTPENKKITIKGTINTEEPDFLQIAVIDEGKGMPPDILEKLNSGKRMITVGTKGEKGNGLGLIMIQTLLSLNKGKMIISSKVDIGTAFSIVLPIVKQD